MLHSSSITRSLLLSSAVALFGGCEAPQPAPQPAAPRQTTFEFNVPLGRHSIGSVELAVRDGRPVRARVIGPMPDYGRKELPLAILEYRIAGPEAFFATAEMARSITDAETGRYLVLDFADPERRSDRPFVRGWSTSMFEADAQPLFLSCQGRGSQAMLVRRDSSAAKRHVTIAAALRADDSVQAHLRGLGDKAVRFDQISRWEYTDGLEGMPASIRQLDGKRVTMIGFALPIDDLKQEREFYLFRSPIWYGQTDIHHNVRIVCPTPFTHRPGPIRVEGRFLVKPTVEDGFVVDVFRIVEPEISDWK